MTIISNMPLEELLKLGVDEDAMRESIDPAKAMEMFRKLDTVSMDWKTTNPPRHGWYWIWIKDDQGDSFERAHWDGSAWRQQTWHLHTIPACDVVGWR